MTLMMTVRLQDEFGSALTSGFDVWKIVGMPRRLEVVLNEASGGWVTAMGDANWVRLRAGIVVLRKVIDVMNTDC
jgi:hypothetical protein